MRATFKFLSVPFFGLMMLVSGAALVGCNTTEGVGEDLESAGDAISDTARDVKD